MSQTAQTAVAVIGIDIGKNSFHIVGHDERGAIVLRQKWSRGQVEGPICQPAAVSDRHGGLRWRAPSQSQTQWPWPRCPADAGEHVRPYSKGQKNDFRDAEAIAEAVQRPTIQFVATKTADQLDLQALHRVRERLVSQRTGIINQIRASCWSAALRCVRDNGSCEPSCRASWQSHPMSCHLAWRG